MDGRLRVVSAVALFALCVISGPSAQEARDKETPARTEEATMPPARPPEASPEPPSVTVLGSWQTQGVLGREVRSTAGENMGRIVDVIVDQAGRVRAAIIDFGGFLGVGSRRIAVDWNALRFQPDSAKRDVITL